MEDVFTVHWEISFVEEDAWEGEKAKDEKGSFKSCNFEGFIVGVREEGEEEERGFFKSHS